MRIKTLLRAATALGVIIPVTPSFAQSSPSASNEGEIIVTARKRQESILKVPVTETVLTSIQIDRKGIADLTDVAKMTVGLNLGTGSVETGSLVSIRGFGTNATDPGVDQSVSLNLDGLAITQGFAYQAATFDMAQVEVLKGPQALFYGKASPAGVISIHTADPGDELEIIARTGYEPTGRESRSSLILSGPLSDTLGVRLAGQYDHFGGYFFNNATPILSSGALPMPHRFGKSNSYIVRGTAVWKPMSNFSARLKLTMTQNKRHGGSATQLSHCPDGPVTLSAITSFVADQFSANEDCKFDRTLALVGMDPAVFTGMNDNIQGVHNLDGGRNFDQSKQKFGSLEMNWDFTPQLTLTSVTGYYRLDVDSDYNCYSSGAGAPACMTEKRFYRHDFTQELRVNSNFSGPLNFTLGGFYQKAKSHDVQVLPGNTNYFLPPVVFQGNETIHIDSKSIFGQVRYEIVRHLEVSGGVRWTHEKRSLDSVTYDGPFTNPAFHTGAGLGTPVYLSNPKLDSKNWAPEFTITYTPTDDLTFFASWKKAYKSGSYNMITPTDPAEPPTLVDGRWVAAGKNRSFGDEKIQGFEIGIKSRLFDRQVDFNLTGYHYKASDLQVGTVEPAVGGLPVLNTLNAASAKIYGIEADFRYRPDQMPGLEFHGAINWNHARFTDFPNAPCLGGDTYVEGCNRFPGLVTSQTNVAFSAPDNLPPGVVVADLPVSLQGGAPFRYTAESYSGLPLVRAPDWSATGGFHYETEVGNDMTLGIGGDVQYSSKYLTLLGLVKYHPEYYQGQYAKLNANVSLKGRNDAWEIAFIGNNLTNKLVITSQSGVSQQGALFFVSAISGGPGPGLAGKDELLAFGERGRELWFRLTLRPAAFKSD